MMKFKKKKEEEERGRSERRREEKRKIATVKNKAYTKLQAEE